MPGLTTLFLIIYPIAQTLDFFVPLREPRPPKKGEGKKEEFSTCSEEKLSQNKERTHVAVFKLNPYQIAFIVVKVVESIF